MVQEAVFLKEIEVQHISDEDNLADLMTKYTKFTKWRKMMDVLLNVHSTAAPLSLLAKGR